MLQYDLTETTFFDCVSRDGLPTDADLFVLTVALLLVRDAAYSHLAQSELRVLDEDVSALAECIEYRLSPLARDFGDPERLRNRLRNLVGLRIGAPAPLAADRIGRPG
jgi:hypothetical protein